MIRYDITEQDRELIAAALEVLHHNFDPHNHEVGCAVRTKDGRVYTGINCDGIHGSCAEFIAVGNAYSDGARKFETIVATHDKAPNKVYAPCGNCRQMLFDYAPDIMVILNDENNRLIKVMVKDLLPLAWKPDHGE
ncbi:MAG: cytidine deaminase [Bacilli bacterium]|jgi:cytidine deaminase